MAMRLTLIFIFLFLASVTYGEAYVPNLVSEPTLQGSIIIDDPALAQTFYGQLTSAPHTYEIRALQPFTLSLKILQPSIESSENNISGIVIQIPELGGRVTEVADLSAKEAQWDTEYELSDGDSYRQGPKFEKKLEAGLYHIEVHTPDNLEKYVLAIGTREEMTIGYFEMVERLIKVKIFFNKSPIRVIESPFVYIPSVFVTLLGWYAYRVRHRKLTVAPR